MAHYEQLGRGTETIIDGFHIVSKSKQEQGVRRGNENWRLGTVKTGPKVPLVVNSTLSSENKRTLQCVDSRRNLQVGVSVLRTTSRVPILAWQIYI